MSKKIVIYPGTFDPITKGHINIIEKAIELFDTVVVVVATNKNKVHKFSAQDRVNMIKIAPYANRVEVVEYDGLIVKFNDSMVFKGYVDGIIRGIRNSQDADYELNMSFCNDDIGDIPTIFIPTAKRFINVSSSAVREILSFNGCDEMLSKFIYTSTIGYIKGI